MSGEAIRLARPDRSLGQIVAAMNMDFYGGITGRHRADPRGGAGLSRRGASATKFVLALILNSAMISGSNSVGSKCEDPDQDDDRACLVDPLCSGLAVSFPTTSVARVLFRRARPIRGRNEAVRTQHVLRLSEAGLRKAFETFGQVDSGRSSWTGTPTGRRDSDSWRCPTKPKPEGDRRLMARISSAVHSTSTRLARTDAPRRGGGGGPGAILAPDKKFLGTGGSSCARREFEGSSIVGFPRIFAADKTKVKPFHEVCVGSTSVSRRSIEPPCRSGQSPGSHSNRSAYRNPSAFWFRGPDPIGMGSLCRRREPRPAGL